MIDALIVAAFMVAGVLLGIWLQATSQNWVLGVVIAIMAVCGALVYGVFVEIVRGE